MNNDMIAMSHETVGFCFCGQMHGQVKNWNEYDWAALRTHQSSPFVPTHLQIAEAIESAFSGINTSLFHEGAGSMTAIMRVASRYERAVKDAVLAVLQNDAADD